MSKIHITLVGGQPMPVYNGIRYACPDKVIFVYSKETENSLELIKKEFPNIEFVETSPLSSSKLDKILERAQKYRELYKNDDVTVNISGGTKPWTYYFAKEFENIPNAEIFYIDQNNKIGELRTRKINELQSDPLVQFRLCGNPLKYYKNYNEYTDEDFEQINKIQNIRRVNYDVFRKLTNLDKKKDFQLNNNQVGKFVDGKSYLEWDKSNNFIKISIPKKDKDIEETFSSENIFEILFNTSWFELKVARIISSWDKVKNVYLNCKFPPHKQQSRNPAEFPKNEIDIIADIGSKLLFVECKTSIASSNDIDKFKNAVRNYGGQSAKALFVVENKIGIKEQEKMKESKIIPFSFQEMKSVNENIQEELIKILDKVFYQLNE